MFPTLANLSMINQDNESPSVLEQGVEESPHSSAASHYCRKKLFFASTVFGTSAIMLDVTLIMNMSRPVHPYGEDHPVFVEEPYIETPQG